MAFYGTFKQNWSYGSHRGLLLGRALIAELRLRAGLLQRREQRLAHALRAETDLRELLLLCPADDDALHRQSLVAAAHARVHQLHAAEAPRDRGERKIIHLASDLEEKVCSAELRGRKVLRLGILLRKRGGIGGGFFEQRGEFHKRSCLSF